MLSANVFIKRTAFETTDDSFRSPLYAGRPVFPFNFTVPAARSLRRVKTL